MGNFFNPASGHTGKDVEPEVQQRNKYFPALALCDVIVLPRSEVGRFSGKDAVQAGHRLEPGPQRIGRLLSRLFGQFRCIKSLTIYINRNY